jgi:methionine-rich copper-binding protein CopC
MNVSRRIAAGLLLSAIICASWVCASGPAMAEEMRVMQSTPAANAVVDSRTSAFFVHFDRPVDHIRSTLEVMQDGKLVEKLQPRLESAPEVLFARAPTLPPGKYVLHWAVRTVAGEERIQGDIPFSVAAAK